MEINSKRYKVSLVFVLLCSIGAAFEVLISSAKYGPGITHDSAAYMYAAQSFLNGSGFQYFGYPSPFIQWPPLYPVLLALGGLAGLASGISSTLINSVAFALVVFFSGKWMLGRFKNIFLSIGGTLLLFLSVPLLQVSEYLWTEILFVLFILLLYIKLESFLQRENYGTLALAALFSALACIDRYAGVTIIAAACLFLLFSKRGLLRGIINAAFFGMLSIIPMGAWVVRNYIVSGTLLGVRLPSTFTLRQNIRRTLNSIYTWVQPDRLLTQHVNASFLSMMKLVAILVPALIVTAFIILLIIGLLNSISSRNSNLNSNRNSNRNSMKAEGPKLGGLEPEGIKLTCTKNESFGNDNAKLLPIAFFTAFSVIYVIYLIASATSVAFEPINSRYLIPVYLPVVLGILTAADMLIGRMKTGMKAAELLPLLLIPIFLIYPAANTAATVLDSWRNGAGGYASAAWREKNGFLEFMQKNVQATYYSNNADVVYVMSGIRTYSPPKKSGPDMYGLEQFKTAVARDENSILIWFDNAVPESQYNFKDLSEIYIMKEIGSFDYGKIYKVVK